MKNYFKLFLLFFITLSSSCKVENTISGNWVCVSGDYYKDGKYNFLQGGELLIDYIGVEGRSQTYRVNASRTYGVADRGYYRTSTYNVNVPKTTHAKYRIEENFIIINFNSDKEVKFLIEKKGESEIILREDNGNYINLKK